MKLIEKGNRLLAMLLTVALLITAMPLGAVAVSAETAEFAGGSGTEADPYLIATKEHLNNVRTHLSAHYKMINNIEFKDADFAKSGAFYNGGAGWEPIGSSSSYSFSGSFNGNSYVVKNLHINISSSSDVYQNL